MKISDSLKKYPLIFTGILIIFSIAFLQAKKDSKARIVRVNGSELIVCPVDEIKDTIHIPLSSLVESFELIKLETTDKALIENAWFTDVSDKYICIKTHGRFPAKLFDRNGKYICDLGLIGRGPGEYNQLYGLQINDRKELVYLLPFGTTRNILVYDTRGKHQKDIPLVYTQRKFKAFVSDESVVTVLSMPFKGDSAICFQQTVDGKLLKSIPPSPYMLSQSFDGELFVNHSTPDFDLFNTSIDTLYHYNTSRNKLEAKFTCEFGGEKKPLRIYREAPLFYYALYRAPDGKSYNILVNKKTLDSRYFVVTNDLFGGMKTSLVLNNGSFVINSPAISLKNQIKSALLNNKMTPAMRQKLTDFDKNLNIDDNNVILYGKLKQK